MEVNYCTLCTFRFGTIIWRDDLCIPVTNYCAIHRDMCAWYRVRIAFSLKKQPFFSCYSGLTCVQHHYPSGPHMLLGRYSRCIFCPKQLREPSTGKNLSHMRLSDILNTFGMIHIFSISVLNMAFHFIMCSPRPSKREAGSDNQNVLCLKKTFGKV